jgi:phosphopantothenoylcysteine decarboxylase / phosphopantothenate---cysteine ligase
MHNMEPSKRIILGITGGIAAYKAAELARLLVKQGFEVQVTMTEAACHFITPTTLQALTGHPVLLNQWDSMVHIERAACAIVIAPASADFVSKLAHGQASDLLSTLCLARNCPLLIAPAMNKQMWANPATQRNIEQLRNDGVIVLGPASGMQACGEIGVGRMLEAQELASEVAEFLQGNHSPNKHCSSPAPLGSGDREQVQPASARLDGVKVLITAGPTYEAIDAVRGITNRSSGKMGYAITQAAIELGADVTLVTGPTTLSKPQGAAIVEVESALDMFEAVKQQVMDAAIFISVAAVADYRIATPSAQKIKKSTDKLTLELVPNPDILAYVAAQPTPPFCVGFAAESENLHEYATAKRRAKKLPLLAANLAQRAIGSDDNELILFDDEGEHKLPRSDKLTQARALLQHLIKLRSSLSPAV